jgi:hypothetical protein
MVYHQAAGLGMEGCVMNDEDDDYEYLFDMLYTIFGVIVFVFFAMGISALVVVLINML